MKYPLHSKLIYLLCALQCLGLLAFYTWQQIGREHPTIMLKTIPVDPRDYLRGDYVILRYEIGQIPDYFKQSATEGTEVFVILQEQDGFATATYVQDWQPEPNERFIRGRVRRGEIVFDLEKYFVPEGHGNPPLPITVEVSLRPNGVAQIKQLYAAGKPWPHKN